MADMYYAGKDQDSGWTFQSKIDNWNAKFTELKDKYAQEEITDKEARRGAQEILDSTWLWESASLSPQERHNLNRLNEKLKAFRDGK